MPFSAAPLPVFPHLDTDELRTFNESAPGTAHDIRTSNAQVLAAGVVTCVVAVSYDFATWRFQRLVVGQDIIIVDGS